MKKQSRTHKGKGLNLEDWLDREAEKREIGERTLPINEMDDIIPIYDTDDLPFEKSCALSNVEGMTAPPSVATLLKAGLNVPQYEPSYEETDEESHEIGFYPLDGRKPFIDWSDREPDGELPFANNDEFAFAVTTRIWLEYKLGNKTNPIKTDIEDKIFKDSQRRWYNLPGKFLAMDVILCARYCREAFENYLSKDKDVAYHLIEASKIRYFKFDKETTVEKKIETLEERKKEIMF